MSEQRALAPAREPVDLAEVRAQRGVTALPTQADINQLLNLGDMLIKSGLLPQSLRTKEAAATVILKGHELGLPPMAAMEGIAVVQGKAVIGAHLLLALVKREYGPGAIWVSETTNERCTVSYRIPGVPNVLAYSFTIEDARQAGLADKQTWRQYPSAMLRARAISAAVKLAFPEVVGGVYVAGELPGTEAAVTDDGDVVIDVTGGAVPPQARAEPAQRPQQPRRQAPQPEPEPIPEGREELPVRWIIRLEELADELPVIESDRLVPADLKRVRMEVMRHVVRRVSGEDSRKYLTREQAQQVANDLTALKARLENDGSGIDPTPIVGDRRIDPETGEVSGGGRLPLVDAEPVEGEPGLDRHTR